MEKFFDINIIQNATLYNFIIYFMIYSFIGWIVESTFKSFLEKKIVNSGFLNGPFIPIYGVGALLIIIFMTPLKENIVLLFLCGFVFMTIFEYIVGCAMEKLFNMKWWDYTGNLLNINGRVCLENSIYWGALSVFLITFFHPEIQGLVSMLPNELGQIFIIIFAIYFISDYTLTIVDLFNLQEKVRSLEYFNIIAEKSKLQIENLEELKNNIVKKSRRLLKVYPKLTYLKVNRSLREVVNDIKHNISNNIKM